MDMSARPLGWIEMAVTGQGVSVHRLYPVLGRDKNFADGSGSLSQDPNVPEDMVAYHLWYKSYQQCLLQCRDHCRSRCLYIARDFDDQFTVWCQGKSTMAVSG